MTKHIINVNGLFKYILFKSNDISMESYIHAKHYLTSESWQKMKEVGSIQIMSIKMNWRFKNK